MILAIIVIGIVSGVTAKILVGGIDTYSFITNRKDATQHARVGMERMVAELNLVEWFDVTWMGNDHLSFIDNGGSATAFQVRSRDGIPTLERGTDFLAGPLNSIDFDYLREDGSNAVFNFQMKKINIDLTIDSIGGYGSITIRTEVFPRNMMYTDFE
jgi:hypothetical protein